MSEVDIIMPNYNKADYLDETINSIIKQDFNKWKLYIIDGFSNDNSFNVLKKYEKENKIKNLKYLWLINKNHNKFYISFLACSDDDCDIEYLNELDRNVPNVDTLDDYNSEKKEVLRIQGADFKYTFSEHIVRLLLGPICFELDSLDEFPIVSNYNYTNKYNCIIL